MSQASMMEKISVNWKTDTRYPLHLQTHHQEDSDDRRRPFHRILQVQQDQVSLILQAPQNQMFQFQRKVCDTWYSNIG